MLRNPFKGQIRRKRSLDALASNDALHLAASRAACAKFGETGEINMTVVDYVVRKRLLIRASYFRQRTGREFYARGAA